MSRRLSFGLLIAANAVIWCVLSLCQGTASAQRTGGDPPFANAVEQRNEMIVQLREIRDLLKEQNALLKSGGVKVIVTLPEKQ